MRAALMYEAGDVRIEDVPDPVLKEPTDALVRITTACVCGSDLHPYHQMELAQEGTPMGHEFLGVVEETGPEVRGLKAGDFVIAPFYVCDGTCLNCQAGYQSRCVARADCSMKLTGGNVTASSVASSLSK